MIPKIRYLLSLSDTTPIIRDAFVAAKPDNVPVELGYDIITLVDEVITEVREMMIPVLEKNWTEEDIDALIAFHESPAGKRIMASMPMLVQDLNITMEPLVDKVVEKMREIYEKQFFGPSIEVPEETWPDDMFN